MAKSIVSARKHAFHTQSGRCIYCAAPMWSQSPEDFAAIHDISVADARRFQLTAEHLVARCEGGSNSRSNIAAACIYCNRLRHLRKTPLPPLEYQAYVQHRIARGRWHPSHLHCMLRNGPNVKVMHNGNSSSPDR